jgi:hypothetical protein
MFRAKTPALLLAAALALTACAGSDDSATSATTPPPSDAAAGSPTPEALPSPSPTADPGSPVEPDDALIVSLTYAGGEVTGDIDRVEVPLGTNVRLTITSDVVDEVHVHGYELTTAVPAGQAAQVEFLADQPGVFEVELHDARKVLTRLQVS